MEKQKKARRRRYDGTTVLLTVIYLTAACGMYYFHEEYLDLGIHFMYKFVLSLFLAVFSFLVFLVRTDLYRGGQIFRGSVLISLPQVVTVLASVPLWVFQIQQLILIRRGIFTQVYEVSMIFAMAGFLYVFGRRGLWLNLAAMLSANFITVVRVVLENGLSVYLEELRVLIVTFTKETGPVIQQMEIHELTFALGVYLVFYLLDWKECRKDRVAVLLLLPTLFCFFSGFKRIGIVAIVAAVLVWVLMKPMCRKQNGLFWLMAAAFAAIAVSFFYLILVKQDLFAILAERFDINTMGRRELSWFIDQYYWIGPNYLGNGAGFVGRVFSDLPESFTVRALHNDILQLYIDIGFWGFFAWMLCWLPLQVWSVYRHQGVRAGLLCLCLHAYVLATAATDNTIYYIFVTGALAIVTMYCSGNGQEEEMGPD